MLNYNNIASQTKTDEFQDSIEYNSNISITADDTKIYTANVTYHIVNNSIIIIVNHN